MLEVELQKEVVEKPFHPIQEGKGTRELDVK